MEEQIQKMQQQSKASSLPTQTSSDIHQNAAPASLNTTVTSGNHSTPVPDTLQLMSSRPNPPTPTKKPSTSSTDLNNNQTAPRNAVVTFMKPDEPMNHHKPAPGVFSHFIPG